VFRCFSGTILTRVQHSLELCFVCYHADQYNRIMTSISVLHRDLGSTFSAPTSCPAFPEHGGSNLLRNYAITVGAGPSGIQSFYARAVDSIPWPSPGYHPALCSTTAYTRMRSMAPAMHHFSHVSVIQRSSARLLFPSSRRRSVRRFDVAVQIES
jgi:hypothetical protein